MLDDDSGTDNGQFNKEDFASQSNGYPEDTAKKNTDVQSGTIKAEVTDTKSAGKIYWLVLALVNLNFGVTNSFLCYTLQLANIEGVGGR